jgi:hypothetical protein
MMQSVIFIGLKLGVWFETFEPRSGTFCLAFSSSFFSFYENHFYHDVGVYPLKSFLALKR